MIKNYVKICIRNIQRNKGYSAINIIGLAIGITVCILIFLFVEYELGFDSHFTHKKNIYRVVMHTHNPSGIVYEGCSPFPLAQAMQNDFSNLKQITQVFKDSDLMITVGDDRYNENAALFVKPQFFEMFDGVLDFREARKESGIQGMKPSRSSSGGGMLNSEELVYDGLER